MNGLTILLIFCLIVVALLVWKYIEIGQRTNVDVLPGNPRCKRER